MLFPGVLSEVTYVALYDDEGLMTHDFDLNDPVDQVSSMLLELAHFFERGGLPSCDRIKAVHAHRQDGKTLVVTTRHQQQGYFAYLRRSS